MDDPIEAERRTGGEMGPCNGGKIFTVGLEVRSSALLLASKVEAVVEEEERRVGVLCIFIIASMMGVGEGTRPIISMILP